MDEISNSLISEIKAVMAAARQNVARHINSELLTAYWNIGKIIVEHEQGNKERAEYGMKTLKVLSKALTNELGKGFSVSNIQFMRRFYQTYQIQIFIIRLIITITYLHGILSGGIQIPILT